VTEDPTWKRCGSGESLAGRIEYVEMNPLNGLEVANEKEALMHL
jgi:predicted AAA+ superfamily ATPase